MLIMAVYMLLVYVWGVRLPALGRDFAILAEPSNLLQWPVSALVAWQVEVFGAWAPGYHLVNLVLLYLTMVCLFWLVRLSVPSPFWMSTLAAVLFMANPATSSGVLHLTAAADLLPCLGVAGAVLLYVHDVHFPRWWKRLAYVPVAFAVGYFFSHAAAVFALGLAYEGIMAGRESRRRDRWIIGVVGLLAGFGLQGFDPWLSGLHLDERFVPLYFLVYPIGFLPETAQRFVAMPWLGWLAAAGVAGACIIVGRKVARPGFWFALAAALLLRLFGEVRPIDIVHLTDSGHLLPASAFVHFGAVALFARMLDNLRWRLTVVYGTTILAAVFFGIQIMQQFNWGHAAELVRDFQARAEVHGDELLGVLPDYQCYKGAPVELSESIRYDTPFSKARPHEGILRLHYAKGLDAIIKDWGPSSGTLILEGAPLKDLDIAPYDLALRGEARPERRMPVTVVEQTKDRTVLHIEYNTGSGLPLFTLPATSPRMPPQPPSP